LGGSRDNPGKEQNEIVAKCKPSRNLRRARMSRKPILTPNLNNAISSSRSWTVIIQKVQNSEPACVTVVSVRRAQRREHLDNYLHEESTGLVLDGYPQLIGHLERAIVEPAKSSVMVSSNCTNLGFLFSLVWITVRQLLSSNFIDTCTK
jgi:hypothetical protein